MPFSRLIVCAVIVIGGLLLVMHGRSLPTWQEEDRKDDSFLYEIFHGPPRFFRARAILIGVILMIAGVIGLLSAIFFG